MLAEGMVIQDHGGPEVLGRQTFELDEPGPREVRVRIRAVALNHLDLWVRRGGPAFRLSYPHRLGSDIAGEVEALGPGARGATVGDRVMVHPYVPHCEAPGMISSPSLSTRNFQTSNWMVSGRLPRR